MHEALDAFGNALWLCDGTLTHELPIKERLTETETSQRDLLAPNDPYAV